MGECLPNCKGITQASGFTTKSDGMWGDQSHTEDMRSDQSQEVNFEVIQYGMNLSWQ